MVNSIGQRIKEYLNQNGYTQVFFATKISVHPQKVYGWIKGRTEPQIVDLCSIVKTFTDIDSYWLITGIKKNEELILAEPKGQYKNCPECTRKNKIIDNQDDYIKILKDELKKCIDTLEKRKAS